MPATAAVPPAAAAAPPAAARESAIRLLVFTELKLYLREGYGPVVSFALPLILLIVFGAIPAFNSAQTSLGGYTVLDTYIPVLIAISLGLVSVSIMPGLLASYRDKGVLRRLQTTPVGPVRVLAAQLAINLTSAVLVVIMVLVVARLGYGVAWPAQLAGFIVAALLTCVALISIGLFIAAVAPTGRAAQITGGIAFYPLMFFAGLWYPLPLMSSVLRDISYATPLGAAVRAMDDAGAGIWPHPLQLLTLAAYAVVFGLAASRLFRWE
jgi:ABC-2 type transport system permease protein